MDQKKYLHNQYFGIFGDDWEQKMAKDYPFKDLDMIFIAFAHTRLDSKTQKYIFTYEQAHNGQPSDQLRINQLRDKAKQGNPQIKVIISLGWGQQDFSLAAKNPKEYAQSIKQFIELHELDGVDLDYEISTDPITVDQFRELSLEIRAAIGNNKLLTITPDDSSLVAWDGQLINQVYDYIQLQTYWKNRWSYIDYFLDSGLSASKTLIGLCTEDGETPEDYIEYLQKYSLAGLFAWRLDTDKNLNGVNATTLGLLN